MPSVTQKNHGRWGPILQNLPPAPQNTLLVDGNCVRIGQPQDLSGDAISQLKSILQDLRPWRKGPFSLYGIHIDSEWRCDMKWQRMLDWVSPFIKGKEVLDIGCGNGYYMLRMVAHQPKSIMGIDPSQLFACQFHILHHFLPVPTLRFKPLGTDDLAALQRQWDTLFCMGVLYHRRNPISCLKQLRAALKKKGVLILETLIIPGEGDDYLVPKSRYAQMKNVHAVPTLTCLRNWLAQAGFSNIEVKSVNRTTIEEQRSTQWSGPLSLKNFLDPHDPTLTIEGYPAPTRAIVLCS